MTTVTVGVGASSLGDAREAARAAASQARQGLEGHEAALVIVYASVRYDLPALLGTVTESFEGVPLVGASSAGQFMDGAFVPPGDGVAVMAMTAGPYRFGVAAVEEVSGDGIAAGRRLAREARAAVSGQGGGQHSALLLLCDGLNGSAQELLTGIHRTAGNSVPVVGGAAGDDRRLTRTYVFHGDRVLTDAAVAVWITSPRPLKVSVAHGWHRFGGLHMITSREGTAIHTIDTRPAAEVWREYMAQTAMESPYGQDSDSTHALSLVDPDGTEFIRAVFVGPDGLLHSFTPIPQFSTVQAVYCRSDDLLNVAERAVTPTTEGRDVGVVLVFSCVSRIDVLGDRASEEAKGLDAAAGGAHTFGFFTYGEFARITGASGVHNGTLTAIAL